MKAAITPSYGPADIIEVREVSRPEPAPDEVVVQVFAAPVTEGDRRMRSADFPGISRIPGHLMIGVTRPRASIQGSAFAGRVVAVGEDVTRWSVGDDLFGSVDNGAYAEFVCVKADAPIARMPSSMSYEEAADVPYGAVTAIRFLRDFAGVRPGDSVLLLGASGGVGRYAIQVAKLLGARVTGVASTRSRPVVMDLGADAFIDYTSQDWRDGDERYDVIFDISGTSSFAHARASLSPTGTYLTLLVTTNALLASLTTWLVGEQRARFGVAFGTQEDLETLSEWLWEGRLRASVGQTFDLPQIADAHALAESGGTSTVMVTPGPALSRIEGGAELAA